MLNAIVCVTCLKLSNCKAYNSAYISINVIQLHYTRKFIVKYNLNMVYISNDGQVRDSTPFHLKIYSFFVGIFYMFLMFFRTLIKPDINKHGNDYTRDYRPGSGPPRPPTRRLGRPNTGDNINIPFGGCRSCAG